VERAAKRESGRAAGREDAELDRGRRAALAVAAVHVARPHPADRRNSPAAEAAVERAIRRRLLGTRGRGHLYVDAAARADALRVGTHRGVVAGVAGRGSAPAAAAPGDEQSGGEHDGNRLHD